MTFKNMDTKFGRLLQDLHNMLDQTGSMAGHVDLKALAAEK
ncbi:hypothetical protein [Diaphorobacter caeni]|nr:hypothetical protein [Diaphorobacter caeni]